MSAEPSRRAQFEQLGRAAVEAEQHVVGVADGRAGIFAAAQPDGRYGVTMSIVAHPVPLQALAGALREWIVAEADKRGVAAELGAIDVHVADIELPKVPRRRSRPAADRRSGSRTGPAGKARAAARTPAKAPAAPAASAKSGTAASATAASAKAATAKAASGTAATAKAATAKAATAR